MMVIMAICALCIHSTSGSLDTKPLTRPQDNYVEFQSEIAKLRERNNKVIVEAVAEGGAGFDSIQFDLDDW